MLASVLPNPDLNRATPMWVKIARPFFAAPQEKATRAFASSGRQTP
jgi:hypothetical protein